MVTSWKHSHRGIAAWWGRCLVSSLEFLLVGDSIVHFVELHRGLTYCFSGAKILDIAQYIPTIIELHPSAHTVFVHVATNDIKLKRSIKLQHDMELLAVTVESLGKHFNIWADSISKKRFFSILISGCRGYALPLFGFIDHFDAFWNRRDLYKKNNLHPSKKGTSLSLL